MKTQEKEKELQNLIKGIKLDSPGNDFTTLVMNRVFEEKAALEKVKKERLFGKGFWIILFLFVILLATVAIFSFSGIDVEGPKLLSGAQGSQLSQGYQSFFSNMGTLPLSVSGILFATSLLLFFDKYLHRLLPNQNHT